MRKIFTLLILLLLLPVTALAAGEDAPGTLWVGRTQITEKGYWKTTTEGNFETGSENDYNVYYDGNGTLTLNGATIQGGTSTGSVPYGAGIYAQCKDSESVSLTIELIGNNTITGYYGIYVNAEISENSNGTDASLTITGENNVSLEVSGSFYGIFVKSGTGNASVTIENASVDAKTTQTNSGYAGVCVQSGASSKDSPNLSLAVNGGSLTTSGSASGDGIQFVVGAHVATRATTSLTVTDNAIVDARNGGISASRTSITLPTPTPSGENSSGIVFDGTEGTVYGEVTLDESLTINQGETLTIPEGSSLNSNGKLTNNGTIIVEKGGNLTGEPGDNVVYAPTITTHPKNVEVKENETATFTVEATGSDLSYQWQQKTTDSESDWTDISEAKAATYTTVATTTDMSGNQYRCVVSNSAGSVTSDAAILTVNAATVPVTGVMLSETELSLYTGNTASLTATVEPDNATNQNVTWSSDNADVATVDNGTVTAVGAGKTTITVTTVDGSKTATCQVTVLHSNLKYFERKEASCTEPGNIEYWYCEGCNKYFSDEAGTTEIKLEDVVIPATGHHYVNGYCTKCGHRDPDYRPDPISYYNIYVEDVCDGVEVSTSKQVVREGGSITVYVEKDTARYTFDNFKVYYKRSYYGTWEELKEGTQPGEYPIKNIWTHIYIKAEGAEEKEDPTGIESIEGVKVYTKDGSLYVQTPQREQVIIVSMSGAVVKNEEQIGLKQYHGLQPGIYIVRVGDRAYKLRL